MNPAAPRFLPALRILAVGALILALLHVSAGASALLWMTRPAVSAVLSLFGGYVSEGGTHLVIGLLRIDWAADYAGFEMLALIWCVVLWNSAHETSARRFGLRMLAAVPTAILVNILRVLTLTAWRQTFFPSVESTPMHWFVGFLWFLPLLALFAPQGRRGFVPWAAQAGLLGAALCMIAPLTTVPGGSLAALCALVLLGGQHWRNPHSLTDKYAIALWLGAAVVLAGSSIPSLWLPWLLLCPWCTPQRWLLTPALLLVPATVPDFSEKFPWLAVIGIAGAAWRFFRPAKAARPAPAPMVLGWATGAGLLLLLILPFTAATLGPVFRTSALPPAGLMAHPIEQGTFLIRLVDQDSSIRLTWRAPNGDGRHPSFPETIHQHAGKPLHGVENHPSILTDSVSWITECFLMPDGVLVNYQDYLKVTRAPFSPAGVHLMASAPCPAMAAAEFQTLAQDLFSRVSRLLQPAAGPTQPTPATPARAPRPVPGVEPLGLPLPLQKPQPLTLPKDAS